MPDKVLNRCSKIHTLTSILEKSLLISHHVSHYKPGPQSLQVQSRVTDETNGSLEHNGMEDYETTGELTVVDAPTSSEEQSQLVIIFDGHICQMSDGACIFQSAHGA